MTITRTARRWAPTLAVFAVLALCAVGVAYLGARLALWDVQRDAEREIVRQVDRLDLRMPEPTRDPAAPVCDDPDVAAVSAACWED